MRFIIAKLRRAPSLLAAARSNIRNPPRCSRKRGAAMMRGASDDVGQGSRSGVRR
jgi:hypothetical protein